MKRFALLLLLCSSAWGAWPVGYTTFFTVTVNAAQVPSTQASFPMYFAGNAALATTGHSGCTTSTSGYDVIFASDAAGATLLSFQLVPNTYNATTGAGEWHVLVPSIAVGTVIYGACGNSGVTSYQGNDAATWASYAWVTHLDAAGSVVDLTDSTGNGHTLVKLGSTNDYTTTGKIDGGYRTMNDANSGFSLTNSSAVSMVVSTFETWFASPNVYNQSLIGGGTGDYRVALNYYDATSNTVQLMQKSGYGIAVSTGTIPRNSTFHHIAVAYTCATGLYAFYIDGVPAGSGTNANHFCFTASTRDYGNDAAAEWPGNGVLDEGRISTSILSADWIKTEYNNQSAPTAFYAFLIPPTKVSNPTFSPVAGTYTAAQSITISTATAGATIRYTVDGGTPSSSVGTIYSTPVLIAATTTVKAIAYNGVLTDSDVVSGVFTIAVVAPVASPSAGSYAAPQTITLSTSTVGATIRYTTDGSTPSSSAGAIYTGPFQFYRTGSVKSIAYNGVLADSTVTSTAYTLTGGGGLYCVAASGIPVGCVSQNTFTTPVLALAALITDQGAATFTVSQAITVFDTSSYTAGLAVANTLHPTATYPLVISSAVSKYCLTTGACPRIACSSGDGFVLGANYVTMQGFEISGCAHAVNWNYINATTGESIVGNLIHDTTGYSAVFCNDCGASNILIDHNIIHDVPRGIYYFNSGTISFNEVYSTSAGNPISGGTAGSAVSYHDNILYNGAAANASGIQEGPSDTVTQNVAYWNLYGFQSQIASGTGPSVSYNISVANNYNCHCEGGGAPCIETLSHNFCYQGRNSNMMYSSSGAASASSIKDSISWTDGTVNSADRNINPASVAAFGGGVDYNDYWRTGSPLTQVGYVGGVAYTSLETWRAGTGLDTHTQAVDPLLVGSPDLLATSAQVCPACSSIEDRLAFIRVNYTPTNLALKGAGSDGKDIGPIPITIFNAPGGVR